MSAQINGGSLAQAYKEFVLEWEATKDRWQDVKAAEFEKKYLDALPHYVAQAAEVMGEIDALLRKVRSDCE